MHKLEKLILESYAELLNEVDINDPALVKARAAKMKRDKLKQASKPRGISYEDSLDLRLKLQDLEDERADVLRNMEQEAEPEGGPIADDYGAILNDLDKKINHVMAKLNQYDMNEDTDQESFDLEKDFKKKENIIMWKDIPADMQKKFSKEIEVFGKKAPGDPKRDYVDKEYETYYFTTSYKKETGTVGHRLVRLPSYTKLYNSFVKIIKDIKVLMGVDTVKNDAAAKEIFENIKTLFRQLQRYLRTNHPKQYDLMKMRRMAEGLKKAKTLLENNYNLKEVKVYGDTKISDMLEKLARSIGREKFAMHILYDMPKHVKRQILDALDFEKGGIYNMDTVYSDSILEQEETDSNPGRLNNIKTFGNLQRFIKDAKSRILGKKVGGALDAAIGFIPGLGNVKTGIDVIRALAKKQDGKTTNTFLDKMDIDDKASAIVDDKVEANFINYMHKRIEDQDPNKTLPSNFDMNKYFNDFLAAEYDKRTIDGINKVTERLKESGQKISKANMDGYKKDNLKESLLDQVNEQEPEEKPDLTAPKETVLEDATDQMLSKFPTLKAAIIKLQTEDFKEFVSTIDWISPRPTTFRVNLKNGQDYILKWTGKTFQAQIMGKRYFIDKINDYQQALDKLNILYKEGPMSGAGEEETADPIDTSGGGGGGDFPGDDTAGGGEETPAADVGGGEEEGGADLAGEPVDFEEPAEEPEA